MRKSSKAKLLEPFSRPFVRSAWYCAGWPEELGEALLARRILDEPVVLYRTDAGEAVALLDICPHKLAPMHLGCRVGANIRCGYHGLEFGPDGSCVRNPQGNGIIPPNARLKSYPLSERHGVLWIWMGDPTLADESLIPDFAHISDPARRSVKGGHKVACNYMMMVENLMDLGHALFLHGQSAGLGTYDLADSKVAQEDGGVVDERTYADVPPPLAFARYFPGPSVTVDFWNDIRWNPPSAIRNYTGAAPLGHARGEGSVFILGSHLLTPETQHSTHYFYAHSRNHAMDDDSVDEFYRNWQRKALHQEDSMVAEAIDRTLRDAEALEVEMVVLSTDISGIKVNQILDRMVRDERLVAQGAGPAPVVTE